jgi:hypothetical protein
LQIADCSKRSASDVRYAVRTLRKAPGFTLVAVFALVVGIAASLALQRLVASLLFGVTATDASSGLAVAMLAAVLRCWPATCRRFARRASIRFALRQD